MLPALDPLNILAVEVVFLKEDFERSMVLMAEFSKTEVASVASLISHEERSAAERFSVLRKARAILLACLAKEMSPTFEMVESSKADSMFLTGESFRYGVKFEISIVLSFHPLVLLNM